MAPTRDYYADLELPQSADIPEIRKQFRKLALRYHPDRNPGREQDVNSQFQIIQAAHEVLSDPQQKAKYDITLSRSTTSRFAPASGTASGVRGNPWQNVGQQFPTPPRRNPQPTQHPPSGAKRWHDRFSYGVPPTAKQKASAEPSTKASAAYAFESMRGGGYQQTAYKTGQRQERPVPSPPSPTPQPPRPRPPPPPPPPRTESAKKRADAAFGTRKTGYYPHSGAGDEPPVANHNYSTRINTERPVPIPDPLSQFRDKDEADDEEEEAGDEEEDFQDSRQRTPYTSLGGERTNPFDGIPLNQANSAKEPLRAGVPEDLPDTDQQSRSSSVPGNEVKDEEIPTASTLPSSRRKARMKTRSTARPGTGDPLGLNANANLKPNAAMNGDVPEQSQSQSQPQPFMTNSAASKMPASGTDGPSMYAMPPPGEPYRLSSHSVHLANNGRLPGVVPPIGCDSGAKGSADPDNVRKMHRVPSGIGSANLTPFERQQYNMLRHLIKNHRSCTTQTKKAQGGTNLSPCSSTEFTNASFCNSFNLASADDAFDTPPPGPSRFNRSSVDDINTNFANDDNSAAWQFSAGSGDADSQSPSRSQSGSRARRSRPTRRSPDKRPPYRGADVGDPPPAHSAQASTGFDAGGWANQFGPQTFVPQAVLNTTASPTRPSNRANSRKTRSAKPTVGNAAVVEESFSDDDGFEWLGRKGQPKFASPESPQAMDIDPPQVNLEEPADQNGAASVRNIPVEPSRPEWRSGDVGSITPEPEQASQARQGEMGSEAQMKPTAKVMGEMMGQDRPGERKKGKEREREIQIPAPILNTMGSEDTDSFKMNMPELSKVAPLADLPSGLKSFADLKANLPFESKASNEIPIETSHAHPLVFPEPPKAPRAPAIVAMEGVRPSLVAWGQYLEEFESYLRLWDIFDAQVVSHFTTRKANIERARSEKGYLFLGARGGNDVSMYRDWIEQDNDVRRRWQVACEEHEARFKEFMAFRERMK